jgi:putative nucleotidyltransferase with HDIG domain
MTSPYVYLGGRLRLTAVRALEHKEDNRSHHELTRAHERLNARLQELARSFVRTIADALEAKDEYTHGHARRVSGYAAAVGRRLGLDSRELERLTLAALLHDIGKIATPDHILLKPDVLTADEREVVRQHAERGARMLAGAPDMEDVADIIRHHHEHFDGAGYPEGLSGEMIPLASRIIHLTDAYDAMTSPRPFREACDHETAVRLIERQAGAQFDPAVVRAFLELEALPAIRSHVSPETWGGLMNDTSFALSDGEPSLEELRREVECDPVLAACVLHEANTRYTAEPTARITEACTRLGDLRLSLLVARVGSADRSDPEARRGWERALRSAEAARLLAARTRLMDEDAAYTLGLLHDIGETLLATLFPAQAEAVRGLCEEARIEEEVASFGVDHAQVGQWVLEACRLPRALTAAVQAHHDVLRINAPVALLLHTADAVARVGEGCDFSALDALGSDRLAMLGLNRSVLADVHARVAARTEPHLAAID